MSRRSARRIDTPAGSGNASPGAGTSRIACTCCIPKLTRNQASTTPGSVSRDQHVVVPQSRPRPSWRRHDRKGRGRSRARPTRRRGRHPRVNCSGPTTSSRGAEHVADDGARGPGDDRMHQACRRGADLGPGRRWVLVGRGEAGLDQCCARCRAASRRPAAPTASGSSGSNSVMSRWSVRGGRHADAAAIASGGRTSGSGSTTSRTAPSSSWYDSMNPRSVRTVGAVAVELVDRQAVRLVGTAEVGDPRRAARRRSPGPPARRSATRARCRWR